MPQLIKSLTSAIRVILGFQRVLGMLSVGVACTPASGRVMCSDSSGVGKGMLICKWGCSSVVMLEPLCSSSGKSMVTDWLHPFKPTG